MRNTSTAGLWQTAIARLDNIPIGDSDYGEAQTLLAQYQSNLGVVNEHKAKEESSARASESATDKTTRMLAQNLEAMDRNQVAKLLSI